MSFLDDVMGQSSKRTSKRDVVDFYQFKYGQNWKNTLVAELAGTTDKKSRAWKSAMRNFQQRKTQKISDDKPTPKWKKIGENLPLKPPAGGYHIWGTLRYKISESCVEREFDEIIKVEDADFLVTQGSETDMEQAVINYYMTGDAQEDSSGSVSGECGQSELNVERVDDED